MRIAITGALGRLGRAVTAAAVAAGHEVISIDRAAGAEAADPDGCHRRVEVTDRPALFGAVEGADALIHLAAFVTPLHDPDWVVHNTNVVASYNSLSVAVELGIERVCLASSVNAIGGAYSRPPRYDYFPVDERHPTYAQDPYSLSKWIAEEQASAVARRNPALRVASLRMHALRDRAGLPGPPERGRRDLWGYSPLEDVARACVAATSADFNGHEICYVVAAETSSEVPSMLLRDRFHPYVPVVGDLSGHRSFFDSGKACRLLGWSA